MDRNGAPAMPGIDGIAARPMVVDGNGSSRALRRADSANWAELHSSDHIVQFYQSDDFLSEAVAEFIAEALRTGDAAVVIATELHRQAIAERLQIGGLDLAAARDSGSYIALDAAETLTRIMVGAIPDPDLFRGTIIPVLQQAAAGGRAVRAFGEMVALLVQDGNGAGAIALEGLWNDLQRHQSFSLLCAYPMTSLREAPDVLFGHICDGHSRVLPAETYLTLETPDQRWRAVATLQQGVQRGETAQAKLRVAEEMLRKARAAEETAQREREAAQRLRDEFLSIASHELRNPLAGLSLHAQLALRRLTRDGHLDPSWGSQALHAITGQATRITRLLDQLLDVSRLETGAITLDRRSVDLTALVAEAVAEARVWSQHHTIDVAAPPFLTAQVDPLRLGQVLSNLLHNAIKHTPAGGAIEVVLSQPSADGIEIVVRDNGPGIPPEAREAVFDRFASVNAHSPTRGLGLDLSRQIVRLHGGELNLELPPSGGTCFVVRLPVAIGYQLSAIGSETALRQVEQSASQAVEESRLVGARHAVPNTSRHDQ